MAYPTLSELKSYLSITGTSEDAVLTRILNGAIAFVERYTGRRFVAAAEAVTWPCLPQYVSSRGRLLLLPARDLFSVTTLTSTEYGLISSTDYILLPPALPPFGQILLSIESIFRFTLTDTVVIDGMWGFSATCPDDVALAILMICQHDYKLRKTDGSGGAASASVGGAVTIAPALLPLVVIMTLDRYKRP